MSTDEGDIGGLHAVCFGPEALSCRVDEFRALKYLGQRGQGLSDELAIRFQDAIRLCERVAQPRGIARSFAINRERLDGIALKGSNLILTGRNIARHLDSCDLACLLAVTLGMQSERELARLQATNPLDALLFDACASSMAEEAAQSASRRIAELADEANLMPTKRFSPGFGDLPLELQDAFLRTIDADKLLGIHTASSHLMTPMKSVTAIVGLKSAR